MKRIQLISSNNVNPKSKNIRSNSHQLFIIIGIVVIVILGILAIPYYKNYIAPFNRTVITIDGINISMKYFIERIRVAGSDPIAMLQAITEEKVIELSAPRYGIVVTDEDIDKELRSEAAGDAESISDIEYKEWYRQQLNNLKISDKLFRQLVRKSLLAQRLQLYLADLTPITAEQIHLHTIMVSTDEDAQKVDIRLKAGEDFATVAKEASLDSSTKDNGGDVGWIPSVLLSDFASQITSLGLNQASGPLPYIDQSTSSSTSYATPSAYYFFMVSEKDSNRVLDENNLQLIKSQALTLWLPGEISKHDVSYNFDSETYAWINWQLEKSSSLNSSK